MLSQSMKEKTSNVKKTSTGAATYQTKTVGQCISAEKSLTKARMDLQKANGCKSP